MRLLFFLICGLILFSCEKEVSVSPPDEPPQEGQIFIDSNPQYFPIYINGKKRARTTPEIFKWVRDGEYKISLKREFYFDTSFTITIVNENRVDTFIDYSKNKRMLGSIELNSRPINSSITFNDSSTSYSTPYMFEDILPGIYTIKLELKDHRTVTYLDTVISSKHTNSFFSLVDTTIWEEYNTDNSILTSNTITALEVDNDNNLWIGTRDGVFKKSGDQWVHYAGGNSELPNTVVTDLSLDERGRIWLCTESGFALSNGGPFHIKYSSGGSPFATHQPTEVEGDNISFAFMKEGYPYILGNENGLIITNEEKERTYKDYYEWGLYEFSNIQRFIGATKLNNKHYIATYSKGVFTFDGDNLFISNFIGDITSNDNQLIFSSNRRVGEETRLLFYNKDEFYWHYFNTRKINKILVDNDNYFWLGTENGLLLFQEMSDKRFLLNYESTGMYIKEVVDLKKDHNSNIWIATTNGLFKIKNYNKLISQINSK